MRAYALKKHKDDLNFTPNSVLKKEDMVLNCGIVQRCF